MFIYKVFLKSGTVRKMVICKSVVGLIDFLKNYGWLEEISEIKIKVLVNPNLKK